MMEKLRFSCIIPAYNEEGRIGRVIEVVKKHNLIDEVIVVSDGSVDNTVKEAHFFGADRVINLKRNLGKGGAVYIGGKKSLNEYLILLDADLVNFSLEHLNLLIENFENGKIDMVIGYLSDDFFQRINPKVSGQRIVKKTFLLRHKDILNSRFKFELLLNYYAEKEGLKVRYIGLSGLHHSLKLFKYPLKEAIKKESEYFIDIFKFKLNLFLENTNLRGKNFFKFK